MDLSTFLKASTREQLRLLKEDSSLAQEVRAYLGEESFSELHGIAQRSAPHLSAAPKTFLFLPGIMGSLLFSQGLAGVWWVDVRTRDQLNRLRLSPDGTTDETPTDRVTPFTCDATYIPFLSAVLADGRFGEPEHFAYDWRKSLRKSADGLKAKVEQMYAENGGNPINLVAHSMGGMMLRTFLMVHGAALQSKINRIVFIGVPHFGAPCIGGYIKDHLWGWEPLAVLGLFMSPKTIRSMRGTISLLPAPTEVYPGASLGNHPCFNFDPYDANAWTPLPDDINNADTPHLQEVLEEVKQYYRDLANHHSSLGWEWWDRMFSIIGVGYQTLFRMEKRSGPLGLWESMNRETNRIPSNIHREGDGRVPVASSQLPNVSARYVKGVHGSLPNIPAVYEEVYRWLSKEPLQLDTTMNGPLTAHLGTDSGSISPHLDGQVLASGDDPGYWNEQMRYDLFEVSAWNDRLSEKDGSAFNHVRLL